MNKKLCDLLNFRILTVEKTVKILFSIMYNFAAKSAKFFETCKKISTNLVNDFGDVPRRGVVPKFSDLVDSNPIPVCRTSRGKRCKMGKDDFSTAPDSGFCASQNTYYFGCKFHELCGLSGGIHSYDLSKASVHDIHYLNDIKPVYSNCSIFGNKAYISVYIQLDLFETSNIRLECPYHLNQKPIFKPFVKARKRVETNFPQLTDQYMVMRNYAKQSNGLFARIVGKISAQAITQYFIISITNRLTELNTH